METRQTRDYDKELRAPIEKRFKRWVYTLIRSTDGRQCRTSDGTVYTILPSGAFKRARAKGLSQRTRRRLYGKMRRAAGLTRSEFDQRNNAFQGDKQ